MEKKLKCTPVVLGKFYKEIIHGRQGIAVSITHYLTGCDRVNLEWIDSKTGDIKDAYVDINQVIDIDIEEPGGPQKNPPKY